MWYEIVIKIFECFAGVMIGKEIIFKKIAKSGKQIIGITIIQSVSTFFFVSLVFALTFWIADIPNHLSFVFGGIALATATAPALSIVNKIIAVLLAKVAFQKAGEISSGDMEPKVTSADN